MKKTKSDNSAEPEPLIDKETLLTAEELKFCELVAGGHTRREAYKQAYPRRAHWSNTTLDPAASKLYNEPRILQVIAHKTEEFAKIHFMSKEYKRAELKSVWEDTNNSLKDRLAALKLDAALAGDLAPTKIENSGSMNVNHSVDATIADALDKLFN